MVQQEFMMQADPAAQSVLASHAIEQPPAWEHTASPSAVS